MQQRFSGFQRIALGLGAFYGFTGVVLGALGAHALRKVLGPAALAALSTATQYQLLHAVGLVAVALAWPTAAPTRLLQVSVACLAAGVLCFSGSLYGLVLAGWRWLGPVTPAGGVLLVLGWLLLLLFALLPHRNSKPA